MKKKVLAVLLTLATSVSLLAGCGSTAADTDTSAATAASDAGSGTSGTAASAAGTETASASGTASGTASADYSDKVSISAWVHSNNNNDGYYTDTNDNPVVSYLAKKFNVDFKWQVPTSGSESEQMNLMIGSGDYTDVFETVYSQESCQELYDDGIIQDLTPYIEKYMPNYMKLINSDENVKKCAYTDDGKMIFIPIVNNEANMNWGGLMYNRQILEKMTDGNVQFPSGKDEPATVADWEYMLGLMKQYYEASGLTDYACLILPYQGFFASGVILNGFGTTGTYYIENDKVKYGLLDDGFYNYLVKMKDWYSKGYIYQDFASRSSDPFYFPNTALTYSGAAGIFYGLKEQLGTNLSSADQGLNVDFRALTAPLDVENNATLLPANGMVADNLSYDTFTNGWVVSSSCSEESLIRWLQVCDYLFTDEGSMLNSYGLTKEQAADDATYKKLGLTDGAYTLDNAGNFTYNPICDPNSADAKVKLGQLNLEYLPGLKNFTYVKKTANEGYKTADTTWNSDGYSACIPEGAVMNADEKKEYTTLTSAMNDYIYSMIPKYIMGTEDLTKESFEAFKEQVKSLGADRCIELTQAAYDRYMAK